MKFRHSAMAVAAILAAGCGSTPMAADVTSDRLLKADSEPGNWMTYHGTYKSWHYSALDRDQHEQRRQAAGGVVARAPAASNRGLQRIPLAIDGVLYYSSSYNQVYALDGATGEVLWSYKQKLNEDLVAKQTHSPYNRGIAVGYGNIYMGTLDGKLVAIDMKTGKLNWETKLVDSEKLTVGFTGAPLLVKDKVIIGAQGGEWPYRGPIFGVDAKTGKKVWQFFTVGRQRRTTATRATPGATTRGRPVAAAAGWPAATIPRPTPCGGAPPTRRRCTTGPGPDWKTKGARPGDNLYTTSVHPARPRHRQAEGLPPGAAARRVGLRLARRASS